MRNFSRGTVPRANATREEAREDTASFRRGENTERGQ